MVRRLCSWMVCLSVFVSVGCRGDEHQQVVQAVIKEMGEAKRQLEGIRLKVEEAVKKSKEDSEGVIRLDKESVEAAKKLMKEFKDDPNGPVQNLLAYENRAKMGKPLNDQQKTELASLFKTKLNTAIRELAEENEQLKKVFAEAKEKDKDTAQALSDDLNNAQGELEKISQRR